MTLLFIACASESPPSAQSSPEAVATPPPASLEQPRTVTDLSQISSVHTIAVPTPQATPPGEEPPATDTNQNAVTQRNIERLFVANLDQARYHEGSAPAPGETNLLNDKARKFADFSFAMLNQTMTAARSLEPDRLKGRKLPDNIGAIELTAMLDAQGRLTEISIESHSGDHQIDEIIVDACKTGVWSRNPPAPAMDPDGKYRVRIRGQITAYSFDRNGVYHYRTNLGLGLL